MRIGEHFAVDPRRIPTAVRRPYCCVESWAREYAGQRVVVSCHYGAKLTQGVAALTEQRTLELRVLGQLLR